ncbi:MAG: ribonuclease III [Planctomycetota bacterium]|nr:ribonuclease III [Planctomycetota bacterium]
MVNDPASGNCGSNTTFLRLQDRIGYLFKDPSLLERALTHPSSTSEDDRDNERMEFLGDSVVNLCVAKALYDRHPAWNEGDLTQVKSAVVSTQALARAAELIGLRDVGRLGKGLPRDEPLPPSVQANLFEAVAAAVYLDGGPDAAVSFVLRVLGPEMCAVADNGGEPNPKSLLQHVAQKNWGITPCYGMVGATGPDHEKVFEVSARLGSRRCSDCSRGAPPETCMQNGARLFPAGTGRSKKEAEQTAARLALEVLEAESVLSASVANGNGDNGDANKGA